MKRMYIYAAVVIVLFGLIFILNQQSKNELYDKPVSQLNAATKEILDDPNYQNIILPKELDSTVKSGEPAFIYFFASNCEHCRATTPLLNPIIDELGLNVPQFNLIEFTEYYRKYNIEYTPTLSYFEGGKEVARKVGGMQPEGGGGTGFTADEIRAFLQNPKAEAQAQ